MGFKVKELKVVDFKGFADSQLGKLQFLGRLFNCDIQKFLEVRVRRIRAVWNIKERKIVYYNHQ